MNTGTLSEILKGVITIEALLQNIIYSSIKNFFENNNDFFEDSTFTNMTEWNLSYHLCNEFRDYIFWLDCDPEVNKKLKGVVRRPDIIFHKRRKIDFNLLAIELKKKKDDERTDISKIKKYWMGEDLNYRFGAYINIWNVNEFEAVLITRDRREIGINEINSEYINRKNIDKNSKKEIESIMSEILFDPKNGLLKLDNKILSAFS